MGFIDIHSHILHSVDDGSQNIGESLKLLTSEKENGCTSVMLTPHFYPDYQSLNGYVKQINENFDELKEAVKGLDLPNLYLGCELRYYKGISNCDVIDKFCLGNTDYLLLELPFTSPIDSETVDEVRDLSVNLSVNVILAHVERYWRSSKYRALLDLVYSGNCLCQIDTDSLFLKDYKKPTLKLLSNNLVSYLGSDAHSVNERPVTINNAKKFMFENGFENQLSVCLKNAEDFEALLNDKK